MGRCIAYLPLSQQIPSWIIISSSSSTTTLNSLSFHISKKKRFCSVFHFLHPLLLGHIIPKYTIKLHCPSIIISRLFARNISMQYRDSSTTFPAMMIQHILQKTSHQYQFEVLLKQKHIGFSSYHKIATNESRLNEVIDLCSDFYR